MRASAGRRLLLRRLHTWQAVTTFCHVVRPPRERGTTWSKVRSWVENEELQYWQAKRSRRNTLNLVNAGRRASGMNSFNEITLGSRISKLGLRTTWSSDRKSTRLTSSH